MSAFIRIDLPMSEKQCRSDHNLLHAFLFDCQHNYANYLKPIFIILHIGQYNFLYHWLTEKKCLSDVHLSIGQH